MKKVIIGLLVFGFATQLMFSQIEKLPEVDITVNYKYLNSINAETQDVDIRVKALEEEVAFYNIKENELYNDEYETYYVTFYIPQGEIVAAYDKDGKIIRTIERFKNIELPKIVMLSIVEKYPKWHVIGDVYKVDYRDKSGIAKKKYIVNLQKDGKYIKVKINDKGEFR